MRTAPTDEEVHDVPNGIRVCFARRIVLKLSQDSLEKREDIRLALSLGGEFQGERAQGSNRIG